MYVYRETNIKSGTVVDSSMDGRIMVTVVATGFSGETTIKDEILEISKGYKYLGITFSRSGSFYEAKKTIAEQATKAMYALLKKVKSLYLPIDMQIDMFMKTVKPILLYGCEIWGHGNLDIIERVQLKFLKHILQVKSSTPSSMIYGETGVKPLSIDIKTRIITFWAKTIMPSENKLTFKMYSILLSHFNRENIIQNKKFPWLSNVRSILIECGLNDIWLSHDIVNMK